MLDSKWGDFGERNGRKKGRCRLVRLTSLPSCRSLAVLFERSQRLGEQPPPIIAPAHPAAPAEPVAPAQPVFPAGGARGDCTAGRSGRMGE